MGYKVVYAALSPLFAAGGFDAENEILSAAGAELLPDICTTEDELIAKVPDIDGILNSGVPLTERSLNAMPRLRGVVLAGHGYDHIDLDAATAAGIPVANTYSCHEEVATHSMLLLLAVARRLTATHSELTEGRWRRDLLAGIPPIYGQTLGLIGLGHIGRAMARRASGFDLNVIAYSPRSNVGETTEDGITFVSLEDLLRESDFVSIHAPLTRSSYRMIGEEQLRMMKTTAYIVNTARGQIIDQVALVRALSEGWIAGAGLDVFEEEPVDPDEPILKLPNVVVTPHAAGTSMVTAMSGRRLASETMAGILQGAWPENLVNKDVRGESRFPLTD